MPAIRGQVVDCQSVSEKSKNEHSYPCEGCLNLRKGCPINRKQFFHIAADFLPSAEAILLDAEAIHKQLKHAKDLAEAVNVHDEGNPACAD